MSKHANLYKMSEFPHFPSILLILTMPPQRTTKSYGPVADNDPALRDVDGKLLKKVSARALNEECIMQTLKTLIPMPVYTLDSSHANHHLLQPEMCKGTGMNPADIGRWFQVVCYPLFAVLL